MVFFGRDSPKNVDEVGQARHPQAKDDKNPAWQSQQMTEQQRAASGSNPEGVRTSEAPHFGRDQPSTSDNKAPTFFSTPAGMGAMAVGAVAVGTFALRAIRK